MANDCWYDMKIKGKKENCQKWIKKMEDYNEPNHFWRFFNVNIYTEWEEDDQYCYRITGDCAWSIESCCRSGYTDGVDLLEINSRELDLEVEIYSEEPGFDFAEHYIYDKGDCLEAECVNLLHFEWDKSKYPTFEDYLKHHPEIEATDLEEDSFYGDDDEDIAYAYASPYSTVFTI